MELWSKKLLMAQGAEDTTTPYEYTSGSYVYGENETGWATKTVYEGTIPYAGNYTIRVAGGGGNRWGKKGILQGVNYGGGGMLDVTGVFKKGSTVKMVLINSILKSEPGECWARGGAGIAFYLDNQLIAVAGGAAGIALYSSGSYTRYAGSAGGGYVGGYTSWSSASCGYSIDGSLGSSQSNDASNGDGQLTTYNSVLLYGGSGYKNTAAGYTITSPGSNGTGVPYGIGAYFSIKRNL